MEVSPSKATGCSAGQEIPHLLWILKVHYYIHKSLPSVPILSQSTSSHSFNINHNIILPSMPSSPKWFFSSGFVTKTVCISHLSCVCFMPRPSHSPCFHHLISVWWEVQIMKLLIMEFITASCFFLPLRSSAPCFIYPYSMFFLQSERPSFTFIQNNGQNYTFIHFHLYVFRKRTRRQWILNWLAVTTTKILS